MEQEGQENTHSGETQEYVEIPDATDQDLDAFLEGASERDLAPQAKPEPTPEPEKTEEKPDEQQPPQAQITREEFERIAKQVQGQELLLKRRTSEIGELKKQLAEFKTAKEAVVDELWAVNPREAHKTQKQIDIAEEKLASLQAEEEQISNVTQAQTLLAAHVGEKIDFGSMLEALKQDGMPQQYLDQFIANPYAAALPETLIQLAKRGAAERRAAEAEGYLQKVVPILKQLVEEKNRASSGVAKNISDALRQTPTITGSAGGATGRYAAENLDVSAMSESELEEILRNG